MVGYSPWGCKESDTTVQAGRLAGDTSDTQVFGSFYFAEDTVTDLQWPQEVSDSFVFCRWMPSFLPPHSLEASTMQDSVFWSDEEAVSGIAVHSFP